MRRKVEPWEAKIIAAGIAARLGIDIDWALERENGRLIATQARAEARRKIIAAMRETLVCPRPMNAYEIGVGLGIDNKAVYTQLREIGRQRRKESAA